MGFKRGARTVKINLNSEFELLKLYSLILFKFSVCFFFIFCGNVKKKVPNFAFQLRDSRL